MIGIVPIRIIGSVESGGVLVNAKSEAVMRKLAKSLIMHTYRYPSDDILTYKPEKAQKYLDENLDGGDEEVQRTVQTIVPNKPVVIVWDTL